MARASTHAKSRALLASAAALVALAARLAAEPPPPRSIEGVAAALGRAAGAAVKPDDFLWEERGGYVADTFLGRRILFLASRPEDGPGAPRDLYRARVRLTRGGRPISVSDVTNLTRTPLGDDRDLTGSGHTAAFATATKDGVQGITLLDLAGDPARAPTFVARTWAALDRLVTTGSSRGLARTEIAFAQPPPEAKLEVSPTALVMSLGGEAVPAAFDLATSSLQTGASNPFGATAQPVPEVTRPAAEVLGDLVARELGAGAGRAARSLFASAPRLSTRVESAAAPAGLRIGSDYPIEAGWPPPAIAPKHPKPFDGEGFWHVAQPMQGPAQQVAAPPVLEAMVRPDPADADALVHLVAIDTRRLDVRLVPGVLAPEPQAGPHGSGRLPRGAEASRVVAAFAAGPVLASFASLAGASAAGPSSGAPSAGASSAGSAPARFDERNGSDRRLGFLAEGRLFAPIVNGAPTLAVRPDGRAAIGAWPAEASRDAFVAIEQGADLDAAGSFALAGSSGRAARAALCRTSSGYLIYAFAASARVSTVRAALDVAGCASGLQIASEPSPLGFAYVHANVAEDGATTYSGTLASTAMSMPIDHLADAQLEALGVLVQRDPMPAAAFSTKKLPWAPDSAAQPPPAWLPGILSFESEHLGAKVKVTAFLPDRATYRLAVGSDEGTAARGEKPGPAPAERTGAMAALGISVARRAARHGLVVRGTEIVRPSRGATWLVLEGARATISRPGDPLPQNVDATEVPLTADEHKLLPAAREVGTQRPRTALCSLPDGTVVIAHTTFDTDEATTEALLDAGCERIVALDRGAHDGVFVHRAGAERAPEATYEATVIYVLPAPGGGTAVELK
jgi:hypothetical protein